MSAGGENLFGSVRVVVLMVLEWQSFSRSVKHFGKRLTGCHPTYRCLRVPMTPFETPAGVSFLSDSASIDSSHQRRHSRVSFPVVIPMTSEATVGETPRGTRSCTCSAPSVVFASRLTCSIPSKSLAVVCRDYESGMRLDRLRMVIRETLEAKDRLE